MSLAGVHFPFPFLPAANDLTNVGVAIFIDVGIAVPGDAQPAPYSEHSNFL